MTEPDELEGLIHTLRAFDGVIIVEGKKDVSALEYAGVPSHELKDSADVEIERLANEGVERVLVLTDRDRTGRKLASQILHACERVGIDVDRQLRTHFFAITKLRTVEGFDTLLDRHG